MRDELPTELDFHEDHGCLDAATAWENFGGLSLDEAYTKFCDNPTRFGEDFMFMGEMAFAYYFNVLDRFVREAIRNADEDRFNDFGNVRDIIDFHFPNPSDEAIVHHRAHKRDNADDGQLRSQVVSLCNHVIESIPMLCIGSHPHLGINRDGLLIVWRGLQRKAKAT